MRNYNNPTTAPNSNERKSSTKKGKGVSPFIKHFAHNKGQHQQKQKQQQKKIWRNNQHRRDTTTMVPDSSSQHKQATTVPAPATSTSNQQASSSSMVAKARLSWIERSNDNDKSKGSSRNRNGLLQDKDINTDDDTATKDETEEEEESSSITSNDASSYTVPLKDTLKDSGGRLVGGAGEGSTGSVASVLSASTSSVSIVDRVHKYDNYYKHHQDHNQHCQDSVSSIAFSLTDLFSNREEDDDHHVIPATGVAGVQSQQQLRHTTVKRKSKSLEGIINVYDKTFSSNDESTGSTGGSHPYLNQSRAMEIEQSTPMMKPKSKVLDSMIKVYDHYFNHHNDDDDDDDEEGAQQPRTVVGDRRSNRQGRRSLTLNRSSHGLRSSSASRNRRSFVLDRTKAFEEFSSSSQSSLLTMPAATTPKEQSAVVGNSSSAPQPKAKELVVAAVGDRIAAFDTNSPSVHNSEPRPKVIVALESSIHELEGLRRATNHSYDRNDDVSQEGNKQQKKPGTTTPQGGGSLASFSDDRSMSMLSQGDSLATSQHTKPSVKEYAELFAGIPSIQVNAKEGPRDDQKLCNQTDTKKRVETLRKVFVAPAEAKDTNYANAQSTSTNEGVGKVTNRVEEYNKRVNDQNVKLAAGGFAQRIIGAMVRDKAAIFEYCLKRKQKKNITALKNVRARKIDLSKFNAPTFVKTVQQEDIIKKATLKNFVLKGMSNQRKSNGSSGSAADADAEAPSDAHVQALVNAFEPVKVQPGEAIVRQGDEGRHLYVIEEGSVEFRVNGKVVGCAFAGSTFGEANLLCSSRENATVVATASHNTKLLRVDQETFQGLMQTKQEEATKLQEEVETKVDNEDHKTESHQDQWSWLEESGIMKSRENIRSGISESVGLDDLERISVLGEGQFGEVWLVSATLPSIAGTKQRHKFALKIQHKLNDVGDDCTDMVKSEITAMEQMNHPFVANLVHSYECQSSMYMLMGLVTGGELWDVIHHPVRGGDEWSKGIPPDHAQFYALVITDTLSYIHSRQFVFRDLKPENVMIDSDGYPIIVDFGFAKPCKDFTYTFCGTPNYVAPEIIQNVGHNAGADYWALGVLIYEMLTGSNPFFYDGMEKVELFRSIVEDDPYPLPDEQSDSVKDLVGRLLDKDPSKRIGMQAGNAQDILDHEWFAGLYFQGKTLDKFRSKAVEAPWIPEQADDESSVDLSIDGDSGADVVAKDTALPLQADPEPAADILVTADNEETEISLESLAGEAEAAKAESKSNCSPAAYQSWFADLNHSKSSIVSAGSLQEEGLHDEIEGSELPTDVEVAVVVEPSVAPEDNSQNEETTVDSTGIDEKEESSHSQATAGKEKIRQSSKNDVHKPTTGAASKKGFVIERTHQAKPHAPVPKAENSWWQPKADEGPSKDNTKSKRRSSKGSIDGEDDNHKKTSKMKKRHSSTKKKHSVGKDLGEDDSGHAKKTTTKKTKQKSLRGSSGSLDVEGLCDNNGKDPSSTKKTKKKSLRRSSGSIDVGGISDNGKDPASSKQTKTAKSKKHEKPQSSKSLDAVAGDGESSSSKKKTKKHSKAKKKHGSTRKLMSEGTPAA